MIIYLISASSGEPAKPAEQSSLKASPHHLHHHSELMIIWVEENRQFQDDHLCHLHTSYLSFFLHLYNFWLNFFHANVRKLLQNRLLEK